MGLLLYAGGCRRVKGHNGKLLDSENVMVSLSNHGEKRLQKRLPVALRCFGKLTTGGAQGDIPFLFSPN
jgi:hypothetical protein